MNDLIQTMVPDDYLESKMGFVDALNGMLRLGSVED